MTRPTKAEFCGPPEEPFDYRTRQKSGKGAKDYRIKRQSFDALNSAVESLHSTLVKHQENMNDDAQMDFLKVFLEIQKVVFHVFKSAIYPAHAEVEALSKSAAIGGHVLKVDEETIGKDGFNEALKRHADERHRDGKRAATGWKEGIAKHLGLSAWKYVKPRLSGWGYDEKCIVELLKEEDRKNESR